MQHFLFNLAWLAKRNILMLFFVFIKKIWGAKLGLFKKNFLKI
jgi:hypothetical protein